MKGGGRLSSPHSAFPGSAFPRRAPSGELLDWRAQPRVQLRFFARRANQDVKELSLLRAEVRLNDEELAKILAQVREDLERFGRPLAVHHLERLIEKDELSLAGARFHERLGHRQAQGQAERLVGAAAQLVDGEKVVLVTREDLD